MRIPINMGVKGRVTATLTNTETGDVKQVKGDNLILNHYLDWAMTQGLGVLGTTTFNRCYIGTSDVPPQPTDTTFVGTQLAVSSSSVGVKTTSKKHLFEDLASITNLSVNSTQGLAVTSDWSLCIISSISDEFPGLRAFKINADLTISPLQIDAFEMFNSSSCRNIAMGGDTLVVCSGKDIHVFRRIGDDFSYVGLAYNISNHNIGRIHVGDSGNLFVIRTSYSNIGNSHVFRVVGDSIIQIGSLSGLSRNNLISPDEKYLFRSFLSNSDIYEIKDNSLEHVKDLGDSTNYSGAWVDSRNIVIVKGNKTVIYNVESDVFTELSGFVLDTSSNLMLIDKGLWVDSSQRAGVLHPAYSVDLGEQNILGTASHNIFYNPQNGTLLSRFHSGEEEYAGVKFYELRKIVNQKQSYSRQWTFPAGTGTGTVNRVGLQANSSTSATGGNNRHVAQIVLPEPLEKTDLHQLDVIWEIEVENPGVWEGVIPGGSRDGSDLAWRVTINEEQFFALVSTGYSISANWFGTTGTPNVRIGTSNEESDLIFDRENIRGEEIQYISSTAIREVNPYTSGSLKRTIRLFLEVNQGNGQIGEIVLGGSESVNSLARITFDPPLDKPPDVGEGANPYRVYLDLEIGWQRGESSA